jgi:hypothetical protein
VVEQKMNLAYSKYVSKPNYLLVLKMLLGWTFSQNQTSLLGLFLLECMLLRLVFGLLTIYLKYNHRSHNKKDLNLLRIPYKNWTFYFVNVLYILYFTSFFITNIAFLNIGKYIVGLIYYYYN